MKIVFPELEQNFVAREAVQEFPEVEFVPAESLELACEMLKRGEADSMISGLDYASREVLLAYKKYIPMRSKAFSSCFVCERGEGEHLVLADGGVNKQPNLEQFLCIIEDTAETFVKYYGEQPRIAILSYSTYGSGGKNPDLEKFRWAINAVRAGHPEWLIDGEMQLDAAVDVDVAAKKTPESPLMGRANILITPDLNSGNILYKSLERFGGFTVAGPMIQGFRVPLADLSRGSTAADTKLTIRVLKKLVEGNAE